jgi:hypothetical protein
LRALGRTRASRPAEHPGIESGITVNTDEGRLYCNLIRSYVTFLMAEHERITRIGNQ